MIPAFVVLTTVFVLVFLVLLVLQLAHISEYVEQLYWIQVNGNNQTKADTYPVHAIRKIHRRDENVGLVGFERY